MTHHAADAVASERAIDIRLVFSRIVGGVDELRSEVAFAGTSLIVVEPALTHHAMTAEAGVVDIARLLCDLRRIVLEKFLHESNFAFELRVENRIATGQSHRRPTPFTKRRNVHYRCGHIRLR